MSPLSAPCTARPSSSTSPAPPPRSPGPPTARRSADSSLATRPKVAASKSTIEALLRSDIRFDFVTWTPRSQVRRGRFQTRDGQLDGAGVLQHRAQRLDSLRSWLLQQPDLVALPNVGGFTGSLRCGGAGPREHAAIGEEVDHSAGEPRTVPGRDVRGVGALEVAQRREVGEVDRDCAGLLGEPVPVQRARLGDLIGRPALVAGRHAEVDDRSEEHTSELQSRVDISYA